MTIVPFHVIFDEENTMTMQSQINIINNTVHIRRHYCTRFLKLNNGAYWTLSTSMGTYSLYFK